MKCGCAISAAATSAGTARPEPDHLRHVDGLRAVAVLAVVAYHAVKHAPAFFGTSFARISALGGHGVELFFVISGLCLAFPFVRRTAAGGVLRFDGVAFFAKRIIRILPPYYATVLVLAVLSVTAIWRGAVAMPSGGGMTAHVTASGLLLHAVFAPREWQELNKSFWTLRIEALWYLAFPLLLLAYVRSRAAFYAIGTACTAVAAFHVFHEPFGTVDAMMLAMPAFMLGIVAADPRAERAFATWALWLLVALGFGAGAVGEWFGAHWDRLAWDVCAFAFVLLASRTPWLRSALCLPVMVAIGIASYSIYLVHEPVIAMVEYVRVPAVAAGLAGLAAGFAFWWAVERTVTHDPVRARLLAGTRRVFALAGAGRVERRA